jgi:hypothetical protein
MEDEFKRDAYLKGLKLKNTGLDEETIGIRLGKQGVPIELAKQVAKSVCVQRQTDSVDNAIMSGFVTKGWAIKQLISEIKLWLKMKKWNKEGE